MPLTIYQQEKILEKKNQAYELSTQGLTTRQIAQVVGKSHAWVALAIKQLSTRHDLTDANKQKKIK